MCSSQDMPPPPPPEAEQTAAPTTEAPTEAPAWAGWREEDGWHDGPQFASARVPSSKSHPSRATLSLKGRSSATLSLAAVSHNSLA